MEKSDLTRLKHEVLDHGVEAVLPVNFSDEWLNLLARDLDMLLESAVDDGIFQDGGYHGYLTAPLAIITHILYGRKDKNESEVRFSEDDLFRFLEYLQFEIGLEGVRRWTDISPEPATLETIFTNREVKWVKTA
ncbi:MAG: hypothetical protein M0Z83_11015 [Betaproteobacteria bacterium]|nr:hypothetical protein [Betaproteobacteria bacterium]